MNVKTAKEFVEESYPESEWPKTFIYVRDFNNKSGQEILSETDVFNVAGIKNIIVKSRGSYSSMTIFLKEGYANKMTTAIAMDKSVKIEYLNRVELYIGGDSGLAERLTKAFYFLCKKYDGSPNENTPF